MSNSFFTSDLFRFGSILLGIIVSSWVITSHLKERTPGKVFEVVAMVTFGIGGFASITSFISHFFFSDMVASSIGWPLIYMLLLWLATRCGKPAPAGFVYKTPQL